MNYAKDGITVAVMLDSRRPGKNGLCPVKIRVTYQRERQYYPTGKTLAPEQWAILPTSRTRTMLDVRRDLESSYQIVRNTVEELAAAGRFSFDALNRRLKSGAADSVNTMFRAKIEALNKAGRVGSMLVYKNVLDNLERFGGGRIKPVAITPGWLERFERFLRDEDKSQTTIAIHLRHLRAILNEAKRAGALREAQYPFGRGRYEIQSGEGRKMALTLEQIGRIAKYDDGSPATAKYRDYWLFLYLCNGINVADFIKLRRRDIRDGEICFVRQKTERTTKARREIRVTLTEPMRRIIDKWGGPADADAFLFPILNGTEDAFTLKRKTKELTRAINKRMSAVGAALGIGRISTYTARHSFATVLKRAGANIAYISESLGHQDLKTTENYLAGFEREERQKNAELLLPPVL
ncbi:MAG: site-specific integrase [Rikenellaceae bacterium]|nr:site-specific integrase [Rikenellaceae bacterium]